LSQIFVLCDENGACGRGMVPDVAIARSQEAHFADMRSFVTRRCKITSKQRRQLRIDKKSHDQLGRMTG
jgi:hypothetical protein